MARIRESILASIALLLVQAALPVEAQPAWPNKPIRLLVPYPVGGIVDIVARAVAESMSAELGQPIVVDPRPGANGTIATSMIPQAPADGYTWVLATVSHVVAPLLQTVSYDPLKDFQGVAMIAMCAAVTSVNPSLPVKDLKELVEYGRAKPDKLNYLNPGNGSPPHLSAELLKSYAKFSMTAVAYRGIPPGMTDLLAGRIEVGFLPVALALQHVQSGKLRAIGVVAEKRLKLLPNVPTYAQQGFGEAQVIGWFSIAVRAGTPPEIINRIREAAMKAIAEPSTGETLDRASCEVSAPRVPAEVQAFYADQLARFAKLVKDAGITGDN